MLYAGLDLGGKRSRLCVVDAQGNSPYAAWTHNMAELRKELSRWEQEVSVAMEATTGCFAVHDAIVDLVKEVKIAHPRDLRAIAHARIKNDRLDAEVLAELNRGNLIPAIWIPPTKTRDERELILEHARVRVEIRKEKVRIRALLRRWGQGDAVEKPFATRGLAALLDLKLLKGTTFVLREKIRYLKELRLRERRLRTEVRKQIPLGERERWLISAPGIGSSSARWLSNVMGDVSRFPDGRHVSSYFGLVPSERTSCTEPHRGPITKSGNKWLRWLFVQCAWASIRSLRKDPEGYWRGMYAALVSRGKSEKRSIIALANRLARLAYALLRDQRPYEARGGNSNNDSAA